MISVQFAAPDKRIDEIKRMRRAINHGHGRGVIELDHRRRRKPHQHFVESDDLRPIRIFMPMRLRMQCGNGGLDRIATGPAWRAQRALDQLQSFFDLRAVPETAILILEQDDIALPHSHAPAGAHRATT